MTARSFWTILLKLLGVYVILQTILSIPSVMGTIQYSLFSDRQNESEGTMYMLIFIIATLLVIWLFLYMTLINPDWTIDKLKLTKGVDENLNIGMHRADILKIVIMVIGGITLVDSLPLLCRDVYSSLQSDTYSLLKNNPSGGYIIVNFIKTAFGIFMLTSSQLIVNYIEKKRRQPSAEAVTE